MEFSGSCKVLHLLFVAWNLSTEGDNSTDVFRPGGNCLEGDGRVLGIWRLLDTADDVLLIEEC